MVMTLARSLPKNLPKNLPKLRGLDRTRLAERIKAELPDRAELADRIKLPELPDRAELARRVKVPDLPDRAELAARVKVPDLPDIDLSGLPRRFPWRQRRTVDRTVGFTPAVITLVAIVLSGIVGALAAYFFDPDRGKDRRIETANRLAGLGREARSRVGNLGRSTTSTMESVDSVESVAGKGHRNGDMTSPDGTIDELVPANPGL
jgi:hypothetical protein